MCLRLVERELKDGPVARRDDLSGAVEEDGLAPISRASDPLNLGLYPRTNKKASRLIASTLPLDQSPSFSTR